MRLKKLAKILVSALLVLVWADVCQASLGISPSRLIEKNLIRGSHLEKTFYLSRDKTENDIKFRAKIEADEIKDWLKIEPGEEFVMKKGENTLPIKLIVDVPKDAALGSYKGGVRISSLPEEEKETGGMGSSVLLGVLVQLDLEVTEGELLEYKVSDIAIPVAEEGSPIGIVFSLENIGNVKARPTKVKVDFFDKYKKELLKSYEISDLSEIKFVEPFSFEKVEVKVPNELAIGQYWGIVEVYRDGELLNSRGVIFDIVEAGSLEKEILPAVLVNKIREGSKSYIGIGLIVLVILVFLGWKKREKIKIIFKKREKEIEPVPDEKKTIGVGEKKIIKVIDLSKSSRRERPSKKNDLPRKNM